MMIEILIVGLGGILGSISRFSIGKFIANLNKNKFYLSTILVNIVGAIILGIISTIYLNRNIYLFLGEGFLGSFTTFSTFMFEGFSLFKSKKILNAISYILITTLLGILGYIVGTNIGKLI